MKSVVVTLSRALLLAVVLATATTGLPSGPASAQTAAPAPSPRPEPNPRVPTPPSVPAPAPAPAPPTVPTPPTSLPPPPDPAALVTSLPYRVLTLVPGQAERSHAATQGVPAALDVNGDLAPDLVVELAGPVLRVARAGPAAASVPQTGLGRLPVRVVVVASAPQVADRAVAFGYDALDSSAPTLFSATIGVLAEDSYSLDVSVAGAGPSLALVATLFRGAAETPRSQWASRSPLVGRLRYAPVPESARFGVQKVADDSRRITVGAARPTVADVLVEKTAGQLKRRVTAHLDRLPAELSALVDTDGSGLQKLEYTASQPIDSVRGTVEELSPPGASVARRHASVSIDRLPASLTVDPEFDGTGLERLSYRASAAVPKLSASFEEREGGSVPTRQARVDLDGLPTRLDVARPSEGQVTVDASPSVGVIHAGFATNGVVGPLTADPAFPAHFSHTKVGATDRTTLRLLGVSRAVLSAGDPFTLEMAQSSQKFKARVQRGTVDAEVHVDRLPSFVKVTYSPATKRVAYTASSTIDRIFVRVVHPTGFVKDARDLTATVRGVPRSFVVDPSGVVPAGSGAAPFSPAPPSAAGPAPGPVDGKSVGAGVVGPVAPALPPLPAAIDLDPDYLGDDQGGGSCASSGRSDAAAFSFDAGLEVLGSVEVTLTNGKGTPLALERGFPAAGRDGVLAVQGRERVHLVGRLSQVRRLALDRVTRPEELCRGPYERTVVDVDTAGGRPFDAKMASSDQDSLTLALTRLVPKVNATFRRIPGDKVLNRLYPYGDRLEIDYRSQPGSTTGLNLDLIKEGQPLMDLEVPRLPSSVQLCFMQGSECARDLSAPGEDNFGSNLELAFSASEPLEAHFFTCFDADGCRRDVFGHQIRTLKVDVPSVQRFDLAVKAPKFEPLNDVNEDGYLFVDTDNHPVQASASYRDRSGSRVQSVRATLPAGFKAQNRKVGLRVLGGGGACCDGVGVTSKSGTIQCPSGTSLAVALNDAPDQQMAPELCR